MPLCRQQSQSEWNMRLARPSARGEAEACLLAAGRQLWLRPRALPPMHEIGTAAGRSRSPEDRTGEAKEAWTLRGTERGPAGKRVGGERTRDVLRPQ